MIIDKFLIDRFLFSSITEIEYCFVFVKEYNIETKSTIQPILYTSWPIKWEIFCRLAINIRYCLILSTMWPIFSELLIFCQLITAKYQQNMRNKESIGHIAQGRHWITSLLMCKYLLSVNSLLSVEPKKHQKIIILIKRLIDN